MPTNKNLDIEFIFKSEHKIELPDAGYTKASPALPSENRLYVIYNDATTRKVYVGTSQNVQARFKDRIEALRELGFSKATLDGVVMYIVQIKAKGTPSPPGDRGQVGAIDVERLLVQTYIKKFNVSVRNIKKTESFKNETGQKFTWKLLNEGSFNVPNVVFDLTWSLEKDKLLAQI